MLDRNYLVNPLSVIFLPQIDKTNGYQTIVCNWQTENIFKINRLGYYILRVIENNPEISFKALFQAVSSKMSGSIVDKRKIVDFIKNMEKEGVLKKV